MGRIPTSISPVRTCGRPRVLHRGTTPATASATATAGIEGAAAATARVVGPHGKQETGPPHTEGAQERVA